MKYEISDQVKNNLLAFLNRVDLKGNEVPYFIEILNVFANTNVNNPVQQEVEINSVNGK